MSTVELKSKIIERVNTLENESLLEEIYQLIRTESMEEVQLSADEITAIEAGLDDIKNGRVKSSEEANKLLNEAIPEWQKKLLDHRLALLAKDPTRIKPINQLFQKSASDI